MALTAAAARARRWALGPGGLTTALTAAVLGAGSSAALHLPGAALLPSSPVGGWAGVGVLAAALVVTELAQAHVEVRRQAYSFSLTGVPLLLGLLFCPPELLVAVRVASAALVFGLQRVSPAKCAFNLSAYLLDVSLMAIVVHVLASPQSQLDLRLAASAYAAMAVTDLLMTLLVLCVIRVNSGPLGWADVLDVLAPAVVFVVINVVAGLLVALLAGSGPLGWALLAAFVAVAAATYRLHLVLRRRHASLELVKDFVDLGARTSSGGGDLAGALLERLRRDVRAERALLLVPAGDDDSEWLVLHQAAEEGAAPVPVRTGRRSTDSALAEVALRGTGAIVRRGAGDRGHEQWLLGHGLREAMVQAVRVDERTGVVVVADRLGETATFGRDDLALLQTLTGHLSVALRNAWLLAQLHHDATHDALTGLANLTGLQERAAPVLAGCAAGGPAPAVLVMALERADEVNAVLGHRAGDELLVLVARRLEEALPGAATARLGGEQFAVLLEPDDRWAGDDDGGALRTALDAADRVRRALAEPVRLASTSVSTSAGIGVAVAEPHDDLGDALRRAHTARTSPSTGRRDGDGPVVYAAAMDEGRAERVELLADLHRALDGSAHGGAGAGGAELMLHYQPKLDLAFGVVTGVEALVRWDHPRLGRLSPDRFVPLAESTGLVDPFTHHLLGVALRQCRAWRDAGVDLSVAVNLSARNVANPDLPDVVAAALAAAGVPAGRLVLELTESSVLGEAARTVPVLERLSAIGVALSLDDFGTGYSSLSYLQRLPVQELKIDQSFVRGLDARAAPGDAAVSAALISSIVALKDALGLRIVAEGVEDADVLRRVQDLGCDIAQGYHISRPAPAAQLDTTRTRLLTADGARR